MSLRTTSLCICIFRFFEIIDCMLFSFAHRTFSIHILIELLKLVFSPCVAAVKFRPVLQLCVVLFFFPFRIVACMLFTLK